MSDTLESDTRYHLPYLLHGGTPGTPSWNILNPGPDQVILPTLAVHTIRAGDVLRHILAGGGWGDPLARDPALVEADVRNGKIGVDHALQEYGVVVDTRTLQVDAPATQRVRAERR